MHPFIVLTQRLEVGEGEGNRSLELVVGEDELVQPKEFVEHVRNLPGELVAA